MTTIGFEVLIGGLTFTGSLMAAGKLQELLPGAPMTYKGQNASNFTLLTMMVGSLVYLIVQPSASTAFFLMVGLALVFGLLLVIPIGAADMPVVISLLNSYAGLADASMGFVLMNKIQIITGSLDGTSGFLLSLLMCRAMNRSAMNVLFGAFGKIEEEAVGPAAEAKGIVRTIVPDEMPALLDGARSVIIVPGYGMAVARAQQGVSELAKLLMKRGINVKYAIHPVAGRMPGHMNVLLAEANVPYDQLCEMEQINPYFAEADRKKLLKHPFIAERKPVAGITQAALYDGGYFVHAGKKRSEERRTDSNSVPTFPCSVSARSVRCFAFSGMGPYFSHT